MSALPRLLALLTGLLLAATALLATALLAALLLLTGSALLAGTLATLIGIAHDRSCVRFAPTRLQRPSARKVPTKAGIFASVTIRPPHRAHEFSKVLNGFRASADQIAQRRGPTEWRGIDITHVCGAWDRIRCHIAVVTGVVAVIGVITLREMAPTA